MLHGDGRDLGVWSGDHARQINTQITDAIDFWLEKDRRQRTLWQPIMQVSERYAAAVREHCVPHDMRALIGLYKDTRAMDIYVWLAYRLPRVPLRHDLFIRYDDLKPIFGTGVTDPYKFRQVFKRALRAALAWYRDARVGIESEGIRIFHSPSPVPIDLERSPYGRKVFREGRRWPSPATTHDPGHTTEGDEPLGGGSNGHDPLARQVCVDT